MGKSAKVHKRVPKKLKSSAKSSAQSTSQTSTVQNQVQNAQKKATHKTKAGKAKGGKDNGHVLGGADYVTLMMGGRRKAREEATKLPQDESRT